MEKSVVTELDRNFVTENSQYGFHAGIQVTQAALSVLVVIEKDIEFIVFLDLTKAYENILKIWIQSKLNESID